MAIFHRSREREAAPPPIEEESHRHDREITARIHTSGCSGLRTATVRGFRLSSGDGADVAGFDIGPSPEEHLLVAVGSSLAQTIAHVACSKDLSVDKIDINLTAQLIPDGAIAHIAGRIGRIDGVATLTSDDAAAAFDELDRAILEASPMTGILSVPIALSLVINSVEKRADRFNDWQI